MAHTDDSNKSDRESDTSSTPSSSTNSLTSSDTDTGSDTGTDPDSEAGTSSEFEDQSESDGSSGSDVESDAEGEVESEIVRIQAWQEIASTIAGAQKRQIRHEAAEVAMSSTPFLNAEELQAYTLALAQSIESNEYPAGFGLTDEYESIECYRTGRSSKTLTIPLPHDIWFSRIVVWCKVVDLLKRLPICREATVSQA